jgi:hypothetical protein
MFINIMLWLLLCYVRLNWITNISLEIAKMKPLFSEHSPELLASIGRFSSIKHVFSAINM